MAAQQHQCSTGAGNGKSLGHAALGRCGQGMHGCTGRECSSKQCGAHNCEACGRERAEVTPNRLKPGEKGRQLGCPKLLQNSYSARQDGSRKVCGGWAGGLVGGWARGCAGGWVFPHTEMYRKGGADGRWSGCLERLGGIPTVTSGGGGASYSCQRRPRGEAEHCSSARKGA